MGNAKQYTGEVVSDKMQKTRIVKITRISKHPKYGRLIKKYNKFKYHDEKNVSKTGDIVSIEATRPISKDKRFKLVKVVKKAVIAEAVIKEE